MSSPITRASSTSLLNTILTYANIVEYYKDYDFELQYHLGKANVVAYNGRGLSQKLGLVFAVFSGIPSATAVDLAALDL